MESIHGIDVSWIHNTHNKDNARHVIAPTSTGENATQPRSTTNNPPAVSKPPPVATKPLQNGDAQTKKETATTPTTNLSTPQRPNFNKKLSSEKLVVPSPSGTPSPGTGRRNSWLSSISSKFSSSPEAKSSQRNGSISNVKTPPVPEEPQVLRPLHTARAAVLMHGTKPEGSEPYVPAPPKTGQPNFLQSALRRLSTSGGQLSGVGKTPQYGLCERRVLNVDTHRERCRIPELNQAKLRRVSFCVDVEIAGGPRYIEDEGEESKKEKQKKKRMVEKGEGEALKHPNVVREENENDKEAKDTGEELPTEPEKEAAESPQDDTTMKAEESNEKENNKKKEKKKRSEEERKARKEKKRKLAEANGTIPVELLMDGSDESIADTPSTVPGTPKSQAAPTTDPVRIYRRCCQLRETPILKKITEQLSSPLNGVIDKPGFVSKLDLSGYWLQLADLVTLSDYLAVVPVKELIMENAGLTDEGVRVLLAGLLAARYEDGLPRRKHRTEKESLYVHQGGVVERIVFKNNPKIGRDGWAHISLFLHMCRSLKCMDLSMIPFPQSIPTNNGSASTQPANTSNFQGDGIEILAKALSERFAGPELELLNLAETGLTTDQLGTLVDAVNKSGLRRLGLAGNGLTADGMAHVARFIKQGKCEGLDLGGIDLKDHLGMIAESLNESHPLWALSLANCGLTPDSLWTLFPALAKLKKFRFIDLSHNHNLFATNPSALSLLRRYLPKMQALKRIHLTDVAMTPEQAIALAEILPESPGLAHVNILENPQLSELAKAKDEAQQEEACALYASLMAAVRVSDSLICIDIDVPSAESSEIVKALAKQVVAYCLYNMERGPVAEIAEAAASISEPHGGEKEVAVPDVLLHLVGHVEGNHENQDEDDQAPDEDYVIGGTGVVKALGICLRNKINDARRPPTDRLNTESDTGGTNTPSGISGGKAKDMSKNLLGSARKIRERLQLALIKEAKTGDCTAYNRLVFLDQTLERMIKRFEDEYPETRLTSNITSPPVPGIENASPSGSIDVPHTQGSDTEQPLADANISDEEDGTIRHTLSRHNSDVSLASKALSQEEGRMHRFGQKFRRDLLKPESEDHLHDTAATEVWGPHLEMLRATMEGLEGEEVRKLYEDGGQEAILKELGEDASVLRQKIIASDPEGWEKFRASQEAAQRNLQMQGIVTGSAIE